MSVKAISGSDFQMMHAATTSVVGNQGLRDVTGLSDMRLQDLEGHVRSAATHPYSFWHGVHHDHRLLPDLLDVYIASGHKMPGTGAALSLLLKQHLPEWDDRRFAFGGVSYVERRDSRRKHQVTVQFADEGLWSFCIRGSEWAYHRTSLKDLRSKKDVLQFEIGIRSRKLDDGSPNMTMYVEAGPDRSGRLEDGVVGEIDVRLDGVSVPFERDGRSSFGYAFRMEESDPSRILTVRPFGYMHTAAFLHSASVFRVT